MAPTLAGSGLTLPPLEGRGFRFTEAVPQAHVGESPWRFDSSQPHYD